jgi:hypothetical protein
MDAETALSALQQVDAVRADVARRATCPSHWHWAFGLLMGAMIGGQSLPSAYESLAVTGACLGATLLMMRAMRRRMGFFVNGYRKGRTRPIAIGLLVFVETTLGVTLWLKLGQHIWWAPLAGAALVAPVSVLGSYAWQRAFRAEMTAGEGAADR